MSVGGVNLDRIHSLEQHKAPLRPKVTAKPAGIDPECARSICGLAAARARVEREGVGCAGVCVCVRRKPGAVFVSTEVQGVAEVWQNSEPFVGSIKALL